MTPGVSPVSSWPSPSSSDDLISPVGLIADGRVLRSESGFYTIGLDTALPQFGLTTVLSKLAGRLKKGERSATNPLAIGDRVTVRILEEMEGLIEKIEPRSTELARHAAGGTNQKHVLVANLDIMVIVVALQEPPPNLPRIDRMLVTGERAGVRCLIVGTKSDLGGMDEGITLKHIYEPLGYPVYLTSARNGEGIPALRMALLNNISVVIGISGVGKSSLLNALQPGLRLRHGDLSEATGKGKHTTTTAEMIPLLGGGYLADTPGLRAIAAWDVSADELGTYFPEIQPLLGHCRFRDCQHGDEPGCALIAARDTGRISPSRYSSYVKLYVEIEQEARRTARKR